MTVAVLSAGFQTTVQDCGRPGFRKLGVPLGGALDPMALRLANILVGNREGAAGLELASGRLRLQFADDRLVAWSGGDMEVRIQSHRLPSLHCARAAAGDTCEISQKHGRAWLAISGGIDVPEKLGSRSTDLRAGFGGLQGRALRHGDRLPLGISSTTSNRIAQQISGAISDWSAPQIAKRTNLLRIIPGKNWTEEVGSKFLASQFCVGINSDRMGLRLEGATIETSRLPELASEAVTPGTIQLPGSGVPIVLLADCQTIGGYPKLAHVITADLAGAAQLQPMDEVTFELTPLDRAHELLRQRERAIALFRAGLQARFG